jgi:hypothetical protein
MSRLSMEPCPIVLSMDSTADPPRYDAFAEDYERHASDSAYYALYDRPSSNCWGMLRVAECWIAGCGPVRRGDAGAGCRGHRP